MKKICEKCGKQFITMSRYQQYCRDCYLQSLNEKNKKEEQKEL